MFVRILTTSQSLYFVELSTEPPFRVPSLSDEEASQFLVLRIACTFIETKEGKFDLRVTRIPWDLAFAIAKRVA